MSTQPEHHTQPLPRGWFKSSYSGGQNGCVEVNLDTPDHIRVRDSKLGEHSPILHLTTIQWRRLLTEVATDHLANTNGAVAINALPERWELTTIDNTTDPLVFNRREWNAFRRAAQDGEFAL